MSFPVAATITSKLVEAFRPTHLEVINECASHNAPEEEERYFKVIVVSDTFRDAKTPLARHRLVNAALAEELEGPDGGAVHALTVVAKTPEQWRKMVETGKVEPGPSSAC